MLKYSIPVFLLVCLISSGAYAVPMTFAYSATVMGEVERDSNNLLPDIDAGNTLQGAFTFESPQLDLYPFPDRCILNHTEGVEVSGELVDDGLSFSADQDLAVNMFNDSCDILEMMPTTSYPEMGNWNNDYVVLGVFLCLADESGQAFDEYAMPNASTDWSLFFDEPEDIAFIEIWSAPSDQLDCRVVLRAEIDWIAFQEPLDAVPEPATVVLLGTGLLTLLAVNRRRS